jgi:hypothetical protein
MCRKNSSFIKLGQELLVFYMKTIIHFFHISLKSSWGEKRFGQNLWRKSKRNFTFNYIFFFRKSIRLRHNVENYCRAG